MRNFIESGTVFYAVLDDDIGPGQLVIVGELVGVTVTGGLAGERIACKRRGVFSLPKVSGAIGQGDKVYKKADEDAITKTATGNTLVGCAHEAAEAGDAEVDVLLKG